MSVSSIVCRGDFSLSFLGLFCVLMFVKSFHFLMGERVELMERSPNITAMFHVRILALAGLLLAVDFALLSHSYESTMSRKASVHLVFGFEYAILMTVVLSSMIKYLLHVVDMNRGEGTWESKAVYMLYAELLVSFIKVSGAIQTISH